MGDVTSEGQNKETDIPDDCRACGRNLVGTTCYKCGWPVDFDDADRGLDQVPRPIAPTLWAVFRAGDWTPAGNMRSEVVVTSALRKLDSVPAKSLHEAGWQATNVGISVTSVGYWQRKKTQIPDEDQELYEYLVRDAVECALLFWASQHGYQDVVAFVDDVQSGDLASATDSPSNIIKTLTWLVDDYEEYLRRDISPHAIISPEELREGVDTDETLVTSLLDGIERDKPVDEKSEQTQEDDSEEADIESASEDTADDKRTDDKRTDDKTSDTTSQSRLGDW
jgi:hypothetical protein